jgi:dipeptidyl aminopeptidase/acylaminoacyl peptidase
MGKLRGVIAVAAMMAALCGAVPAGAQQPAPAMSDAARFAATPAITDPVLSADGNRLAYGMLQADGRQDVIIANLATGQRQAINLDASLKLRRLQFEESDVLLITTSDFTNAWGSRFEQTETFAVPLSTGRIRRLRPPETLTGMLYSPGWVVSLLPQEADALLYSTFQEAEPEPRMALYRLRLSSDATTRVNIGTSQTYDWLVDDQGTVRARADFNDDRRVTSVLVPEDNSGRWREVLKIEDTPTWAVSLLAMRDANRAIVRVAQDLGQTETSFEELKLLNLQTGRLSTLLRVDDTELESTIIDPWLGTVTGVALGGLDPRTAWIDPELDEIQAQLEANFPGERVNLASTSRDRSKVVFSHASAGQPPVFMLYDRSINELRAIGRAYPRLEGIGLGQTRATTFKARDGTDIPVYLTLPPGNADVRNAPAVVFPHGGPAARDYPDHDWWAQFMATRGYVVIQPQFRGSTGFGAEHEIAGRREWGRLMQDDLNDAMDWAVSEGLVDPRRVCIVGASYGGYAALAGVTLTPDRFACAVSVAGVSDLPEMLASERRESVNQSREGLNYWRDHMGADDDTIDLAAVSPSRLADRVRVPVLLIHGRQDTVVNFDQSERMARALRREGKPHRLVELRNEDHWLSRAPTRQQMLEEVEQFLAASIGRAPPP